LSIYLKKHQETTLNLMEEFHADNYESVAQALKTDIHNGLSKEEARNRFLVQGPNDLSGSSGPSIWKILFSNIANPMNVVLGFALILSAVSQDVAEVVVIAFVIITNSYVGFKQEAKSEKTMDTLRKLASPTARVVRHDALKIIPATELVPGDLVFLEEGDQVPADLRLVTAVNLHITEALLTGEPLPVRKNPNAILNAGVPLGDRINLAFASTLVTLGRGSGLVIRCGLETEMGAIAKQIGNAPKEKTPLEKTMLRMMLSLLAFAVLLAVVVFAVNKWNIGDEQVLLYAIATAVAILPEGLPAVTTITLALGVQIMASQKAIVRRLAALEALGGVTNICSDKTGTLTEGKMSVAKAHFGGLDFVIEGGISASASITHNNVRMSNELVGEQLRMFILVASLCNTCTVHFNDEKKQYDGTGDTTEVALAILGEKLGYTKKKYSGHIFLSHHPFRETDSTSFFFLSLFFESTNNDIALMMNSNSLANFLLTPT